MVDLKVVTTNNDKVDIHIDKEWDLFGERVLEEYNLIELSDNKIKNTGDVRKIHILEGSVDLNRVDVGGFYNLEVLTIAEDVHIKVLWCEDTMVKELVVPTSIEEVSCNPNTTIKNFDDLRSDVKITMIPIDLTLEKIMNR